jgi:GrpB-like predicted nucleotidyltransferase (UPF0157 family)
VARARQDVVVRIYRFDEVVSRPVVLGEAGPRIVNLVSGPGIEHCDIVHLAAGDELREPGVDEERLLAVLGGSGWAEGTTAEGPGHIKERRLLKRFEAALFAPGEPQWVGAGEDMTLVVLGGSLLLGAMEVTTDIELVEYDPAWLFWFEQLHEFLWPAIGDLALGLDHVGSTSVPGLVAKPIIDLDIVVSEQRLVAEVVGRLEDIGYTWRGDLGVTGREAFFPPATPQLPRHHLYLVVEGSKPHLDHVLLSELLRRDEQARIAYGELKVANAEKAAHDMDYYVAAKAAFVARLLERAREEKGLPPASYWEPELEFD